MGELNSPSQHWKCCVLAIRLIRHFGVLSQIRTETIRILSPFPLPIGVIGHGWSRWSWTIISALSAQHTNPCIMLQYGCQSRTRTYDVSYVPDLQSGAIASYATPALLIGVNRRNRTSDILLVRQMLSHLSYIHIKWQGNVPIYGSPRAYAQAKTFYLGAGMGIEPTLNKLMMLARTPCPPPAI